MDLVITLTFYANILLHFLVSSLFPTSLSLYFFLSLFSLYRMQYTSSFKNSTGCSKHCFRISIKQNLIKYKFVHTKSHCKSNTCLRYYIKLHYGRMYCTNTCIHEHHDFIFWCFEYIEANTAWYQSTDGKVPWIQLGWVGVICSFFCSSWPTAICTLCTVDWLCLFFLAHALSRLLFQLDPSKKDSESNIFRIKFLTILKFSIVWQIVY